jgi:hypothetical protein
MGMLLVLIVVVIVVLAVTVYKLTSRMKMYEDDIGDILEVYEDINRLNREIDRLDGCVRELIAWNSDMQRELSDHKANHVYCTTTANYHTDFKEPTPVEDLMVETPVVPSPKKRSRRGKK